ncbi:hypothetical protein ScPMuIL_012477 [Solemya velum]
MTSGQEKSCQEIAHSGHSDCSSGSGSSIEVDRDTISPNKAWLKYVDRCRVTVVEPMPNETPIFPDKIRFVCLSDTHAEIEKSSITIPDGDVLLHAGDFSNGSRSEVKLFNQFLGKLPHKYKIVIAGNMDLTFEGSTPHGQTEPYGADVARQYLPNCTYLQDSAIDVFGVRIYGSPWQPEFCCAFNLPRGEKLLQKWNKIPADTDILLTHGPPLGYGDSPRSGGHVGCVELLNTVQRRVRPKYHVYGHVHEGYGVRSDGQTVFINASHMNRDCPINQPIIFDFPLPKGFVKEQ